ncbi:hypothetical protein NEF87_002916 [Candidatus Lokiarchaeum ossiferum]|uniref:Uncharacterized protein n=1 Tax=Candidatus Lokiarchaeum ossiferum TaxID=2951803 RepID=A0ABY6HSY8_9ARCH|nr:hypothetical protein NEF87_002916 [Candidatus Lokiarchaeum sp. B-35]
MSVLLNPLVQLLPKNKLSYRIYCCIFVIIAIFAYFFFPTQTLPGANFVVMGFAILFALTFYYLSFSVDREAKPHDSMQYDGNTETPAK